MAYTTNPYVGKTRRLAVNDVRIRKLTYLQAALKYGVTKGTICKWMKKASPDHREFINTLPSRPKYHPNQLSSSTVRRIVELRAILKRCAPVIHEHLRQEGISVSLSSVARVLRRLKLTRKKRQARYYTPLPRPVSDAPGALVQVDTIHYVRPNNTRFYIYALIDTYTRLAYAEYHPKLRQHISLKVVSRAQEKFGFKFNTVQTDNGPEFKDYLNFGLKRNRISLRHSRVRTPNDNAHVERFNRTIQEECFDRKNPNERTASKRLTEYIAYYNEKRLHLGLNLLTPTQFVSKVLT
jgi:transposase InsO family protein